MSIHNYYAAEPSLVPCFRNHDRFTKRGKIQIRHCYINEHILVPTHYRLLKSNTNGYLDIYSIQPGNTFEATHYYGPALFLRSNKTEKGFFEFSIHVI